MVLVLVRWEQTLKVVATHVRATINSAHSDFVTVHRFEVKGRPFGGPCLPACLDAALPLSQMFTLADRWICARPQPG